MFLYRGAVELGLQIIGLCLCILIPYRNILIKLTYISVINDIAGFFKCSHKAWLAPMQPALRTCLYYIVRTFFLYE